MGFRSNMEELWKPIPGYEDLYEASTFGRIRSIDGKTTSNKLYSSRVWKQRIMKLKTEQRRTGNNCDQRVVLWKNGESKTFLVARLVAMTWVDGYKNGFTVNHIDGNSENNNISNLEWVSLAENINKGFDDGLYSTCEPCELIGSNGESLLFRSRQECCAFLGRGKSYITNRVVRKQLDRPVSSIHGDTYRINLKYH